MAASPLDQQIAGLRAQLAAVGARGPGMSTGMSNGWSGSRGSDTSSWLGQQYAINAQLQDLVNRQGTEARTSGRQRVDDAREEMYDLARGDLNDVRGDPLDASIRQQLMARINGGGPYTETVRNAYLTDASNQSAAAQQAQLRSLAARGLSPGDPAFQAAVASMDQQRSRDNQSARLSVNMNADLANYNAQGQNLTQGNAINDSRYGRLTDASRNLQGLLSNEVATEESGGDQGWQMPTYTTYTQSQQRQPAQPTGPNPYTSGGGGGGYGGLAPRAPDMSGWTPAQVAAYTGRQPTVQMPARVPMGGTPTWTASGSAGTATGYNAGYKPAASNGAVYGPPKPMPGGNFNPNPWAAPQSQQGQRRNTNPRLGPVANYE